jgi:CrcB protein
MKQVLWVGVGGFLGAVLRYGVGVCLPSERFGMGTLAVNTLGCLAVGAVVGWIEMRGELEAQTRALLVVGVLGSFTTFSALGNEVMELAREGRNLAAGGVVAAHLALGLGAVVAGRALSFWVLR